MRQNLYRVVLILAFLFASSLAAEKSIFIAKKGSVVLKEIGDCDARYSPRSTFKVALLLMGFDAKILESKDSPRWMFKKEYEKNFQGWYTPKHGARYNWFDEHTPSTFIQNSVLWYSHQITQRLGKEKFKEYVSKLKYGNKDVSGAQAKVMGSLTVGLIARSKFRLENKFHFLKGCLQVGLASLTALRKKRGKCSTATKSGTAGSSTVKREPARGAKAGLLDGLRRASSAFFSHNILSCPSHPKRSRLDT
jgi:beta-lactamase class D